MGVFPFLRFLRFLRFGLGKVWYVPLVSSYRS